MNISTNNLGPTSQAGDLPPGSFFLFQGTLFLTISQANLPDPGPNRLWLIQVGVNGQATWAANPAYMNADTQVQIINVLDLQVVNYTPPQPPPVPPPVVTATVSVP